MVPDAGRIEDIDSLYICGLPNDVLRSCRASLARDRAEGARIAIVSLFGTPPDATVEALAGHDIAVHGFGLPASRDRHPHRRPIDGFAAEPAAEDDVCREQAAERLHDIGHRTRVRQVYAPLGVGGHPDRRIAHEAARKAFRSGGGRQPIVWEPSGDALLPAAGGDARTDALAAAYGRRLRAGAHAERYWLLLPPLAGDGWEDLPLASGE